MSLSENHRPRRFDDLWQWPESPTLSIITREIAQKKLQTPMLIRSDYGEGKTTLARIIGRRACCRQTDQHTFEPCGRCDGCRKFRMDGPTSSCDYGYLEMDCTGWSASEIGQIVLRNTIYTIFKSSFHRWVVCLDEIGRQSIAFQRQLLKLIENSRVHFILCSGTDDNIDRALSERCVIRPLSPPTPPQCQAAVKRIAEAEGIQLHDAVVPLLVTRLGCNPRRILNALSTAASLVNGAVGIQEINMALAMHTEGK